jgi:hypothetical protein
MAEPHIRKAQPHELRHFFDSIANWLAQTCSTTGSDNTLTTGASNFWAQIATDSQTYHRGWQKPGPRVLPKAKAQTTSALLRRSTKMPCRHSWLSGKVTNPENASDAGWYTVYIMQTCCMHGCQLQAFTTNSHADTPLSHVPTSTS